MQVRLEEELRKTKEDLEGCRNDLEMRGAKLVILQNQVRDPWTTDPEQYISKLCHFLSREAVLRAAQDGV